MRILLVNPTLSGEPEAFHLGLATIGTMLAEAGHEVSILDFAFHRKAWRPRLDRSLEEHRPELVGIYISTPFFPNAKKVADAVREKCPGVKILAGGHHATLSPDDTFAHPTFDLLVFGEGELPTLALARALEDGTSLDEVPGLWWRDANGDVHKVDKPPPVGLDRVPTLNWDLYDRQTIEETYYFFGLMPIMGSRGCPYKCSFCAITNVQRLYKGEQFLRFRDPIRVVDEIEAQYEKYKHLGLRLIYFYDLNFLIRTDWLKGFTDEYKRRGLHKKLKWSAYTRADHVNRIAMDCLKDSGCVALRVGIEAANPTMRNDVYDKALPQEELHEAIRLIKQAGISVMGYFLAGGPGERPEWLLDSLELAYDYGLEQPVFFLYKPLAGTDVLERAAEMGSFVDTESMADSADFIRGVNMKHANVEAWQLEAFVKLTQVVFGARLVAHQITTERLAFFTELARYAYKGFVHGFSPFEVLVYYVFYGGKHLAEPPQFPIRAERSPVAKALFWTLRKLWRSKDGGPENVSPKVDSKPKKAKRGVLPVVST